MKKIWLAILFCLILLPVIGNTEDFIYSDPQNHYSFVIPSGWVEIPKTIIDNTFQQVKDQYGGDGGEFLEYVTGFQLDDIRYFQYPYILIQEYKVDTPSYDQIIKTLESEKTSKSFDKAMKEYSEAITDASFQSPFLDKNRNIVFMNVEGDVVNVGTVNGLIAMFLGKEDLITLNFYSIKSEYLEDLSTFNEIINSFKYEQGYEYNEEEAKRSDSLNIFEFEEAIIKGIGSGIAFGFLVLIIYVFRFLKKKFGDYKKI